MKKEDYIFIPGKNKKLLEYSTKANVNSITKLEAKVLLEQSKAVLSDLQNKLFAQAKHALLIVIQGVDAGGKDSIIKKVFSDINPHGYRVASFKSPSEEELVHDYLWRCNKELPARGCMAIFNRSYYEEVLIVRVHEGILKKQNLPNFSSALHKDDKFWMQRMTDMVNYENYLINNGIQVLKVYLHISKDEQKRRFLNRINLPEKNWKFALSDIEDRRFWDFYMEIYEKTFNVTSTKQAPWHIVPGDDKWFARLILSQLIVDKLEGLKLQLPELTEKKIIQLKDAKEMLENGELK